MMRDLTGYGQHPPLGTWPNGARLAISIVLNYEEGSERALVNGDPDQESGTEWGQYDYPNDVRNLAMESMYEYGARVGVWRIFDSVDSLDIPITVFACAVAFELNPAVANYVRTAQHEVCSHGYRWEEVFRLTRQQEQEHIRRAIRSFTSTVGTRPVGWYNRYGPSIHTRQLLLEEGGFEYDSDSYADDSPFYVDVDGHDHLVLPYTPDTNDFRFWQPNGPITAAHFTNYLIDSFETLYEESQTTPRMMSIGLHPRIIGRPGRIGALRSFIEHAKSHERVWFTTRKQIARAWRGMTESSQS